MQEKEVRGYHKPIMLAGGIGNIRGEQVQKGEIPIGAKLIVLGGAAMNIGLGGGGASSMDSGKSKEDLDLLLFNVKIGMETPLPRSY